MPGPAVATEPGFTIGPDDVLAVIFWREKDLSADEVIVRPDGKITLPILNDIHAAGLTPDQLRDKVAEVAGRYVQDPSATVVVRAINSRRVFITGQVNIAGPYALNAPMTVLQLIATAGGLAEWAKGDNVVVMRTEGGRTQAFKFNYREVIKGKKLEQNIELCYGWLRMGTRGYDKSLRVVTRRRDTQPPRPGRAGAASPDP